MEEDRIQKKMELGSKMGWKARHSCQRVCPQHPETAGLELEAQQQCSRKPPVPHPCLLTLIFIQFYCDVILKSDLVPGRRETLCAWGWEQVPGAGPRAPCSSFVAGMRSQDSTCVNHTRGGSMEGHNNDAFIEVFVYLFFHLVNLDPPAPTARISWVIS